MSAVRAAALSALLLAGCAMPPPPAAPAPLAGSAWLLESLADAAPPVPVTLGFTADRVSGVAPCNSYTGGYEAKGAAATIGPVAATRRACPQLDFEARYLSTLTDVTSLSVEGDWLILRGADGAALMRFRRA